MDKAIYYEILNYQPANLALLNEHFNVTTLHDPAELNSAYLSDCALLFAPLGYHCGKDIIEHAPRMKVIATNTTGVPHIDVAQAQEHGIQVVSLQGDTEFLDKITPTAELTIGLIIAITRNLMPALEFVRKGKWGRWDFGGPAMLSRMSLGLVGFGRLGKMVARTAHALGMQVGYYDPHIHHDDTWPYRRFSSLEELVANNHIVSAHVVMKESNQHMFNAALFSKFKRGSYFVNTARGELVDSQALINAMESGIVAGAALDVIDHEFEPGFDQQAWNHPLIRYAQKHGNLLITPHIAGSTLDAWSLTQRRVIERAIALCGPGTAKRVKRRRT